jgi:hypothetical protein
MIISAKLAYRTPNYAESGAKRYRVTSLLRGLYQIVNTIAQEYKEKQMVDEFEPV